MHCLYPRNAATLGTRAREKGTINGEKYLVVMLLPRLQPYPVCISSISIRFANSNAWRLLPTFPLVPLLLGLLGLGGATWRHLSTAKVSPCCVACAPRAQVSPCCAACAFPGPHCPVGGCTPQDVLRNQSLKQPGTQKPAEKCPGGGGVLNRTGCSRLLGVLRVAPGFLRMPSVQ